MLPAECIYAFLRFLEETVLKECLCNELSTFAVRHAMNVYL